MMIRPTTTIGVQPNTRLLRIERVPAKCVSSEVDIYNTSEGAWMVWINANINFTLGTYIKLNDDGTIERVTVLTDGTEDIFVIKKKGD